MKIAVTGAFSYSGKYITKRLLARGDQVITLTGHPRRPDPFEGRVSVFRLDFADEDGLTRALKGIEVLVNTYWIRFDRGTNTQAQAVENTKVLVRAAKRAGVDRLVHISITNPSSQTRLQYFRGKAANEETVVESGIPYAILRPTILFGKEAILINNIAYLVRRFPALPVPGDGLYRVQPVYVDDLAEMAEQAAHTRDSYTKDAVGPETYAFRDLVSLIADAVRREVPAVSVPPWLALRAAQILGLWFGDVLLTPQEIAGLMSNLLISDKPAQCKTELSVWLHENRDSLGTLYASELARHY